VLRHVCILGPACILTPMNFEYEITADDYAACRLLHYKLSLGRKLARRVTTWFLAGLFLIALAWTKKSAGSDPLLLTLIGAASIYCGLNNLFPQRYFRRAYRRSSLAGKKFKADVGEGGFEIKGDFCSWGVKWPGVLWKGEDKSGFMLATAGTIFMFGKKYLNTEQQEELRRLSGLKAV